MGNLDTPIGPVPDTWTIRELKSLCSKIGSGATPRGGNAVYLLKRDVYALIRSQNVFDRRFDEDDLAFISDKHAEELRNVELEEQDLLLNITGDGVTFSRACMVPPNVLPARVNQHVCIIRPRPGECYPGYLLSFLTHPLAKPYIESFNSGGSRRAITKGSIESFEIPLPPTIEEQRAIAHILGTLDDKIELNRRMNRTLEAMTQAIFKSWFVNFEPVKAKAAAKAAGATPEEINRAAMAAIAGKTEAELAQLSEPQHQSLAQTAALFPDALEDSEIGHVPEGWQPSELGDVLELAYGKALKKSDRKPGQYPVYGSGGITGFHDSPLVAGPGIIIGRKGTVGSLYWEDDSFFPIDTVFYVKPFEDYSLEFIYYLLETLGLDEMNTDAAVPGLNRNNAYRIEIPDFPSNLVLRFTDIVGAFRSMIRRNLNESRTLSEIRDTLLPRLLSGELSLSIINIQGEGK